VQIPGSVAVDANDDGIVEQYVGITSNAADAAIEGLEWEGQAIVAEDLGLADAILQLSWALGLMHAGFNKFIDENGNDVADESRFANTPKWNAATVANYSFPVSWFGKQGDLAVIATLSLRGDEVQFYTPDPLIDQQAYALWDMSLVWTGADGRWQVGLYGQNLTDKAYKVTGMNIMPLGLEDNVTAYYGNPRQYWLAMQYRFQ
jgi:iron complex outermembrane receptor protein